jgi:hypothetical protein
MSSPASSSSLDTSDDQLIQLLYLGTLHAAINETCKERNNIKYASGTANPAASLPELEKFLCKLALICDTTKGGTTVTSLVCLKGRKGPEYVLASNQRKEGELKDTVAFLSDLLDLVAEAEKPAATSKKSLIPKPLQKQVLWRILEFNAPRIGIYLKDLVSALEGCKSKSDAKGSTVEAAKNLPSLANLAGFSLDLESSDNARDKSLSDLESLIKAIHDGKGGKLDQEIDKCANSQDEVFAEPWRQLRHYLGRLHSYRQAADLIIVTSVKRPGLFKNFKVGFIASARLKKIALPRSSNLDEVLQTALPEHLDSGDFDDDLEELRDFGLEAKVRAEHRDTKVNTRVHCETHLHNYLVKEGKIDPADYWGDSMFIACSKPTCRLCHYYFKSPSNDFRVQPPHMNLYYKWRLSEVDRKDEEALERYYDIMDEIIDQLQEDTLELLKQKVPLGKRNDSRTDSSRVVSRADPRSDTQSNRSMSAMSKMRLAATAMIKEEPDTPILDDNGEGYDDAGYNLAGQESDGVPLVRGSQKWPLSH